MKYSTHSTYYNEEETEVPSVTTIIKVLNKPFLQKWANIMGFKKRNIDDILEQSSLVGTMVHKIIDAYLTDKYFIFIPVEQYSKLTMMHYLNSFINWKNSHESVEPISTEVKMSTKRFGGTVDFYGTVDGKYTILDFKTSKKPYSSMILQLAAYCIMLEEKGEKVDQAGIIIVGENGWKEKMYTREELQHYVELFTILVEFFHGWYDLNLSHGWGDILGK